MKNATQKNVASSVIQEIDGSARKPALVHDTDYMLEKTYHLAPCFSSFESYLMPP